MREQPQITFRRVESISLSNIPVRPDGLYQRTLLILDVSGMAESSVITLLADTPEKLQIPYTVPAGTMVTVLGPDGTPVQCPLASDLDAGR